MAERESCARVTRSAAKKRAAEEELQQGKNKRVVLGEIQNVLASQNLSLHGKRNRAVEKKKPRPKRNLKSVKGKESVKEEGKGSDSDVEEKSEDPQMCRAYASDIQISSQNGGNFDSSCILCSSAMRMIVSMVCLLNWLQFLLGF